MVMLTATALSCFLQMLAWKEWDGDMHEEVKTQEETTIIGQVRHFCSRIIWLLVSSNYSVIITLVIIFYRCALCTDRAL